MDTTLPVRTMAEENAAPSAEPSHEQDINPWSVEGARTETGEVAAIDYEAIAKYVRPWLLEGFYAAMSTD